MPAIAKTQASDADIDSYLHTKVPAHRHAEARALVQLFEQETGFRAVIWGAMIGFGRYEYTYQSGHSGESLATGFAFRKTDISIYGLAGFDGLEVPLQALGKHRLGKILPLHQIRRYGEPRRTARHYPRRADGLGQTMARHLSLTGQINSLMTGRDGPRRACHEHRHHPFRAVAHWIYPRGQSSHRLDELFDHPQSGRHVHFAP